MHHDRRHPSVEEGEVDGIGRYGDERRRGRLFDNAGEQILRTDTKSICELTELEYVQLSFAALDLSDEGVGAAEPARKLTLCDAVLVACRHKSFHQRLVA